MLERKLVFIDQSLKSEQAVINFLSDAAYENGYLNDREAFVASVVEREKEFPTAFGYNVAIPHGKSDSVKRPFVGVCRTKEVIGWGKDQKEVKLVFIIGVPEKEKGTLHLKTLSQISRNLMNEEFRNCLLTSKSIEKMFCVLESVEKEIILN